MRKIKRPYRFKGLLQKPSFVSSINALVTVCMGLRFKVQEAAQAHTIQKQSSNPRNLAVIYPTFGKFGSKKARQYLLCLSSVVQDQIATILNVTQFDKTPKFMVSFWQNARIILWDSPFACYMGNAWASSRCISNFYGQIKQDACSLPLDSFCCCSDSIRFTRFLFFH